MKIIFIDPESSVKGLNVGLGYLASVLSKENVSVKVIDLNNNNKLNPIERVVKETKDADLIGISIKSYTVPQALNIVKWIENLNNKLLICGGPHITLDGKNFMKKIKNFKVGVYGEAENTIKEIKDYIDGKIKLNKIKGIIYRDDNELIETPPRPILTDLDKLPFPEYEHFDSFNGFIRNYPIITSRGCPYSCIYCCVSKLNGKIWRARSPKNVVEELLQAKDKYNIKEFSILDDNFTFDIKRAKKICEILINEKLNLKWSCPNGLRADKLDEELIELMKEAGCYSISIGVESADEKVFKNIRKGETLDDIVNAISLAKKAKLEVVGFFIVGLPFDNVNAVRKSIAFAKKYKLKAVWNMFSPYPNTEAWDWVKTNTKLLKDWSEGFHFGCGIDTIFETKDFSRADKIKAYYLACLDTQSYNWLFDYRKNILSNFLSILKIIWKYEKKKIPFHMIKLLEYGLKSIISGKLIEYQKL
jgi:radical SAM superfamily enzyme YgiQ (UPF0313 family)